MPEWSVRYTLSYLSRRKMEGPLFSDILESLNSDSRTTSCHGSAKMVFFIWMVKI